MHGTRTLFRCGHCQHFAPTYIALANRVADRKAVVRLGALNCVAYGDECSRQEVQGYPTLRAWHVPGALSKSTQKRGLSLEKLDHTVKAFLTFLQKHHLTNSALNGSAVVWGGVSGSAGGGERPFVPEPTPPRAAAALQDAAASAVFALQHGVFAGLPGSLGAARHGALTRWLSLLATAWPVAGGATGSARPEGDAEPPSSGAAFAALLAVVEAAGEELNATRWQHALLDFRLVVPRAGRPSKAQAAAKAAAAARTGVAPPPWDVALLGASGETPHWSRACTEGSAAGAATAYTCGLWALLHTLTFAAPSAGVAPSTLLRALRDFVDHFFG